MTTPLMRDIARRARIRQVWQDIRTAERFWSKVDTSGGRDACWPWTGSRDTAGYGQFMLAHGFRLERAHRLAWAFWNHRLLPADRIACHHCDNPSCCNPTHIYAGTSRDNALDTRRRSRAPGVKLTATAVAEIRSLRGMRSADVGARYGVGRQAIENIWRGRSWAD